MESETPPPVMDPTSPSSSETLVESEASPATTATDPSNDSTPSTSGAYPMRRRRNPAVLIRWIEEHPFNPYPTKGEKQGLAFYAGMTQRQLNDWFANARRNIKKVGYENWKKKHNGFSAILSGIPLAGNNCNLSILSAASPATNGSLNGGNGAFTNTAFTNTAFTLNRPNFTTSAPCSVMSYPSNGPMSLATCVKPTPLPNSAGFVKVEGGGTYYGGGYLAHAAVDNNSSLSPCSSAAASVCLSSLPFSHESYQLATGHTQAATGPLLAVDANLRPFSNWAHQPVPVGSTTVLNHASFGFMSHTPPPPSAPSQCASEPCISRQPSGDALQQEQENSSSPHESGYYSSTASPTPNHHR